MESLRRDLKSWQESIVTILNISCGLSKLVGTKDKVMSVGQQLTVLNIGHNGTCLLCPENDLAKGVVQYSVNSAGPAPFQVPNEKLYAISQSVNSAFLRRERSLLLYM